MRVSKNGKKDVLLLSKSLYSGSLVAISICEQFFSSRCRNIFCGKVKELLGIKNTNNSILLLLNIKNKSCSNYLLAGSIRHTGLAILMLEKTELL